MSSNSRFFLFVLGVACVVFTTTSCSSVFFEQPVPQHAAELETIPAYLSGLFQIIEEDKDKASESLFRDYLRLDRIGNSQVVATGMKGISVDDLSEFDKTLASAKSKGEIQDYFVSEAMVWYAFPAIHTEDSTLKQGAHSVAFEKYGNVLLLPQSRELLFSFDLLAGKQIVYDRDENARTAFFEYFTEFTDSLSFTESPLVAKGKKQELWFSVKQSDSTWSLIYIKRVSKNELLTKHSVIGSHADFKKKWDYYNAITPFKDYEEGNDYLINPTDAQLKKLLADPDLFSVVKLKRVLDR